MDAVSEALLRQLGELPGVVGSLLAGLDGAVREQAFPAIFERQALEGLAATLARESRLPGWLAGEDAALDLRYVDGRVLVRSAGDALLLVLCTAQVDPQLLQLAMTQAVRRLRRSPGGGQAAAEAAGPSPSPVPRVPGPGPVEAMVELLEASLGGRAGPAVARLLAARGSAEEVRRAVEELGPLVREAIGPERAAQVQYLLGAIAADPGPLPG